MSDSIPERPQSSFTSRRPAASNLPHFALPPPPELHSAKTSAGTLMGGASRQDFGGAAAASQSPAQQVTYPQMTGSWPTPKGQMPSAYGTYNTSGSQDVGQTQPLPRVHSPSPSAFQQFLSSISSGPFPGAESLASITKDGGGGGNASSQQQLPHRNDNQSSNAQGYSSTSSTTYQLPGYSTFHQPPSPGYYYSASTTPQQASFPAFPPPQPSPPVPSPSSSSTYRTTPVVPSSYSTNLDPKQPGGGGPGQHHSSNSRPIPSPLGLPPQSHQQPSPMHPPQQQQQEQEQPSPMHPPPQHQPSAVHQPQSQQPSLSPGSQWLLSRPLHPHPHHGPIMSNLHQPGSPMSLIPGGPGSGHLPAGGQAYSHGHPTPEPTAYHRGPAGPVGWNPGGYGTPHGGGSGGGGTSGNGMQQQDRPFKCDQCPQSFNRNHDLKRHKRIHLPVKPFPCGVCEKSFSRKDALKRHRLVKECGGKTGAKVAAAFGEGGECGPESPGSEIGGELVMMKVEIAEDEGGGLDNTG